MDEQQMGAVMSMLPTIVAMAVAPLFVVSLYFIMIFWDRRENRPHKDDTQLGTKLVLWGFILAGVVGVIGGADQLITFVFSGFKGGFGAIKGALSSIVSGAVVAGAFGLLFLPRTNNATQPQIERYAMGARIRTVVEGPDGALWVLEDERRGSGGRLLKLTPKG